jgi:catechol 2,3-dioxygenase-like lactoylglutathione lyase family enzyme
MAEFKTVVRVLKVSDMRKAVDFYTGVLGLTVAWRAANDGGGKKTGLHAEANQDGQFPWSSVPGAFPSRRQAGGAPSGGVALPTSFVASASYRLSFMFFGQEVFVKVGVLGRVVALDVVSRQD